MVYVSVESFINPHLMYQINSLCNTQSTIPIYVIFCKYFKNIFKHSSHKFFSVHSLQREQAKTVKIKKTSNFEHKSELNFPKILFTSVNLTFSQLSIQIQDSRKNRVVQSILTISLTILPCPLSNFRPFDTFFELKSTINLGLIVELSYIASILLEAVDDVLGHF